MENAILKEIIKNATEKANEYHLYHNNLELNYQREKRRINDAPPKTILCPEEWAENAKYNPFYVLKKKEQIARSITHKIIKGTYQPHQPFEKKIPKVGGGERKISVYQIPDSAVSDYFYHNLLKKNKHRFSTLSYAYRNDRNIHFAIQDIANELTNVSRIFVAEFDFSDFFGSISHEYLFKQFEENAFLISDLDEKIIKSFLKGRELGIPQGTSISLFLANMVCWKLDRQLESEGIRFARYADDTIIWSRDYTKISKAFDIISDFSKAAGIKLNYKKSLGISLLQSKDLSSEFSSTKEYIEFLGYRISYKNIGIKNSSVLKIKKQISYLLYKNLIEPLKSNPPRNLNVPANNEDRDFTTAIMQIRRYLYGGLSEMTLQRYIKGANVRLNFKGVMSFYPLLSDDKQMVDLDRWLISTILNVLSMRKKLLLNHNPHFLVNQFPFNCNEGNIITECRNKVVWHKKGLIQIPSFLRIYKAIRIGVTKEGIETTMNKKSSKYYDS